MANYTNITATANIKPMAGKLKGIFVSAASSTPTITVYDSAATSTSQPTMLSTFTPAAATSYLLPLDGAYAKNGIYVVIGGTVTATVIYE